MVSSSLGRVHALEKVSLKTVTGEVSSFQAAL